MKKKSFSALFIVAILFIGCSQTQKPKSKVTAPTSPAKSLLIQQKVKPGLHIEIITVKILPNIEARYQTMNDIPRGLYQYWQMDANSVIGSDAVKRPNQKDSIFVEVLALIENDGSKRAKFKLTGPRLVLTNGRSIPRWEYLVVGQFENYDAVVHQLRLTDDPPVNGSLIRHLFGGDIYCELKSMQQTWVILIFQIPNGTKVANLVVSSYPPVSMQIPM